MPLMPVCAVYNVGGVAAGGGYSGPVFYSPTSLEYTSATGMAPDGSAAAAGGAATYMFPGGMIAHDPSAYFSQMPDASADGAAGSLQSVGGTGAKLLQAAGAKQGAGAAPGAAGMGMVAGGDRGMNKYAASQVS